MGMSINPVSGIDEQRESHVSDTYSSQPVWYHEMTVAIPKTILHPDHGMLIIGGGDNIPAKSDTMLKKVCGLAAATLGAVVSFVGQVPNQPIVFKVRYFCVQKHVKRCTFIHIYKVDKAERFKTCSQHM